MIRSFIVLTALFSSVSAFAHIEPSTWTGVTAEGAACSLVAAAAYFENQVPHPLNERVPVTYNGTSFVLAHPPVVDPAQGEAFFNHAVLQAILPTDTGAQALVVDMVQESPRAFHFVQQDWQSGEHSTLDCTALKHQP